MSDSHNHDHDHHHDHGEEGHHCSTEFSALAVELREHIPFSVAAVAIGLIVAGAICILGATIGDTSLLDSLVAHDAGHVADTHADHDHAGHDHAAHDQADHDHAGHDHGDHDHAEHDPAGQEGDHDSHSDHDHGPAFALLFFHLFHPAHMLFSGAATAAMFMRYERRVGKAIVIGLAGAVVVCGISDIAMPQLSLLILGTPAPWHLCIVEHPGLVLPFAVIGVGIGIATASGTQRTTILSHSLHVLASTMASIFYMVGPLGVVAWIGRIGAVFVFIVIAVVVPCCLSDIVFPMLMSRSGRRRYEAEPHVH